MFTSTATNLFLLLSIPASVLAADSTKSTTTQIPACTATASSGSGAFFDLRPDIAVAAVEGKTKPPISTDYIARGYDYGSNFTLNICGPVVKTVKDVVGIKESLWQNISAYYKHNDEIYSIG
jgi:cation-dependent mannose-6-phosphate receptor